MSAYNRNHSAHPRNLTCPSKYLNMLIPKTKNTSSQKSQPPPHYQVSLSQYPAPSPRIAHKFMHFFNRICVENWVEWLLGILVMVTEAWSQGSKSTKILIFLKPSWDPLKSQFPNQRTHSTNKTWQPKALAANLSLIPIAEGTKSNSIKTQVWSFRPFCIENIIKAVNMIWNLIPEIWNIRTWSCLL